MRPASQAQQDYLNDLQRKHPEVYEQIATPEGLASRSISSLTVAEATKLIGGIVSIVKGGKEGQDGKIEGRLDDDIKHGEGDGQGQGQQQGQGQGQGEQGGQGQNDNQEDKQMQHEYRQGSKQQIVADALIRNNMDERATFQELKNHFGKQPLEFTQRGENGREPLPMGSENDPTSAATQFGRGRKLIKDTKHALEKDPKNQGQNQQQGGDQQGGGQQQQGGGGQQESDEDYLLRKIRDGRAIQENMAADGKPFGTWGMRQAIYGARMLKAGFPPKQILDAISMEWPVELRREWITTDNIERPKKQRQRGGLPEFDVTTLWKHEQEPGKHGALPALKRLALAGVPIFLHGPAGCGKTTLAEHLCDTLNEVRGTDYEFGFASMTAGTSPGEFKGRITLDGFLPSLFVKVFSEGGVFLFDELDAGDENLLTLLNSALANGYFVDNKAVKHYAHEHFVPVAAGNTLGLGANTSYTGRNRIDGATLDRFCNGRVRIELDEALEERLYREILAA